MAEGKAIRWTCGCCGGRFEGLNLDFAFRVPDAVVAMSPSERSELALTHDFCSDGETHYLRCILEMPVEGLDDALGWGVWIELDHPSMMQAVAMHDRDAGPDEPVLHGRLANALPPFPGSLGQRVAVRFRSSTQRPTVHVDGPGPVGEAQHKGVPMATVELLNRPFHAHGTA